MTEMAGTIRISNPNLVMRGSRDDAQERRDCSPPKCLMNVGVFHISTGGYIPICLTLTDLVNQRLAARNLSVNQYYDQYDCHKLLCD
jgi:hypothetical protein